MIVIDWEKRLDEMERPVWIGRTQAKYAVLAERIRLLARDVPPGTQLPTVRRLAKAFGVTVPPIQKALSELDREGVITVRHGSGSFVAGEQVRAMPFGLSLETEAKVKCRIQSNNASQMGFWREAAKGFAAEWPGSTVEMVSPLREKPIAVEDVDLVEVSTLQWPMLMDASNLVMMEDGRNRLTNRSASLFLHQSQLFCLFYNLDQLERRGIEPPAYTDFAGQLEWCRRLAATGNGSQDSPLLSSHQPIFLLGQWHDAFSEWLIALNKPTPSAELLKAIAATNALSNCSKRFAPNCGNLASLLFMRGEAAALQDFIYNIADVEASLPKGRWGYCPVYAVDDTIPCQPIGFAVRRDSPQVTAALRFVMMLQQDEWQNRLPDHHMSPLDTSRFRGGARPEAWGRTSAIRFRSPFETALWTNVVVPEWWRWKWGEIDAAEFLEDCRRLSSVLVSRKS